MKPLCVYYSPMRPEQYRAWCEKLNKEVKGNQCNDTCGWYKLKIHADDLSREVSSELEEKIKNESNKE